MVTAPGRRSRTLTVQQVHGGEVRHADPTASVQELAHGQRRGRGHGGCADSGCTELGVAAARTITRRHDEGSQARWSEAGDKLVCDIGCAVVALTSKTRSAE